MKEVLINSTSQEVRAAIVEEGELVEFMVERAATRRLVGDIYLGRVNAILPGIQAAFVDIGYEKAGFLHASDLVPDTESFEMEGMEEEENGRRGRDRRDRDDDEGRDDRGGRREGQRGNNGRDRGGRGDDRGGRGGDRGDRGRGRENRERPPVQPIEKMLTKGQEVLVQVTKEAIGTKGPRLTTQVSLPGRHVVYMPNSDYLGISRRIESRQERARLRQLISKKKPPNCAVIARTACEGVEDKQIVADINYLHKLWQEIRRRAEKAQAPELVHEEVGMVVGMVRDLLAEDIDKIWMDNEREYRRLVRHLRQVSPELASRTLLFRDKNPIFEKYNIENEIEKTLERKVWLKKGGYLVFDQTEAMVVVDVNTGRFVGKRDQEETILETNLLAAREVPRQLRLRDIGGIIVIDFIDMESEANKKKVLTELRNHLRRDRSRAKAFAISDLGLVEISRKRVRPSLLHFLSEECPYCRGTGKVLSFDTLANKVERQIHRIGQRTKERRVQLRVNTSFGVFLEEHRASMLESLEKQYRMRIEIQDDPRLHREDFKLVSLSNFRDLVAEAS
ncbi:MAG TPA: Rne/Rng family ribonuclease [Candidatus Krumholzibacteria bacterium]|nr:Rne/Rng family ribonuclease [Candidatus Krumholzibacteria bacterium]